MERKTIALTGGKLIDGSGRDPADCSTVLICEDTISAVGRQADIQLPEGCKTIDVSGKTIMPGLMDLHVHLSFGQHNNASAGGTPTGLPFYCSQPAPWFGVVAYAYAQMALEMGFTTLRDVGEVVGADYSVIALRDAIHLGIVQGPRIFASGPFLSTTCGHGGMPALPLWLSRTDAAAKWIVDTPDECLKAVRERIKMGADLIKIFGSGGISDSFNRQEFNDEALKVIVAEAHSKGRPVAAHLEFPEGIVACVNAGIDTVEHGWILNEEAIEAMLKKKTTLVPTLSAVWNLFYGDAKAMGLPQSYIEMGKKTVCEPALKSVRMAYEAGVKIAMGTDCGYPPCRHGTNAKELELLVSICGMSPMEAIVTSSKNCAQTLHMESKLGTLEPGKLADVLVVDGDPLEDIKLLQEKSNILMVMKGGSVCVDRLSGR